MDNTNQTQPTGCCPIFNPAPWQEKEITWDNKLFVTDHVKSFLHIPLNMSAVMTRMCEKIKSAGADVEPENFVMLSDECSAWKSAQFMAVKKEVPGMENVKISGTFLTKVFEGQYKEVRNWYKEMLKYVEAKGKKTDKIYIYYTTCPKCAKAYGKNYVVLFAQIG